MIIFAAVSTSIGLFFSSLVKSEQQFMAVSMLVSMPSIFLSGAFLPVQAMPVALQKIAAFLPITYAADAFRGIMIKGLPLAAISQDIAILLLFLAVMLGAVFITFRRDIE
jgi:ABC-2 type transport system permease protein